MKTFLLLSSITFMLFFGIDCLSQDRPVVSTNPPPPATNFLITKEIGRARVTYSKSKDESIASTKNSLVYGKSLDGVVISAQFLSKGKKLSKPENIILRIYPAAKDRTYIDDRTIKIYTDKKEVINGTSNFIYANSDGRVTIAALEQNIPYKTFTKMSKAKIVKMQIGPTIFELTDSNLEAFQDLLKIIED
ncbi:MAG: hypothetical protein M3405_12375 [Acidobacteriota bacterium]|jgi:hypothetical protein|nr:hypothetical protein [Acidobacteriota bacterium]